MNEKHAELTSALLDGELDVETSDRTITRLLDRTSNERTRFGRYRLIGDVMRGESAVYASSLADQVSAALEDEPVVLAPRRRSVAWTRPVAGAAIAASVAAAAIFVAPQILTGVSPENGTAPQQMVATTPRPALQPTLVAAGNNPQSSSAPAAANATSWQALDKTLEDRLNRLVIEHHEFGGRTGINGPVAHIGLVSYDER